RGRLRRSRSRLRFRICARGPGHGPSRRQHRQPPMFANATGVPAGVKLAEDVPVTIRSVSRGPAARWIPRPNPASVAPLLCGAVSAVSERAGGLCAGLAFRHPPRFPATRAEVALLGRAVRSSVRGPLGDIAVWHWGEGPRVLLAHGWGSHAGRLTPFVTALLASGFGVTAFDAPGHGASTGRFASLPDFVEALDLVARIVSPIALVGHSLGAAAAALAMRSGIPCRAAVLLSAPADPAAYTRRYARWMRLSPN